METVIVLGASNDSSKYAYKAVILLKKHNHRVIPVHPKETNLIDGIPVISSLNKVKLLNLKIDTITMYVNPKISSDLGDDLISLNPKRVIFNPGSENDSLSKKLEAAGISVENACTLVLLHTGQY